MKTELNEKEKRWVADFKRLLNRKPKTIEVVVDDGSITIYPVGTLTKHMASVYNYGGIGTDPDDSNSDLASFQNRGKILPYSEGQ